MNLYFIFTISISKSSKRGGSSLDWFSSYGLSKATSSNLFSSTFGGPNGLLTAWPLGNGYFGIDGYFLYTYGAGESIYVSYSFES